METSDVSTAVALAFAISKETSLTIASSAISKLAQFEIELYVSLLDHRGSPLWPRIFMTFKYFFSSLKNRRRISSKELATKMAFVKPFIHELNLRDIKDREGFIRTALLLGAPYDPQLLCGKIILANTKLSKKRKEKLVDWLLANNFLNKDMQPLSVSDYGSYIKKGYYEHVQIFMSRFPNWINTSDDSGTVLSKCVPKMKMLLRYMSDIKKQFGARKLIDLLVHSINNYSAFLFIGDRFNYTCFSLHAQFIGNGIRWPTEMVIAMMEIYASDDLVEKHLHSGQKSIDMLLYHMFPQHREILCPKVDAKRHALRRIS